MNRIIRSLGVQPLSAQERTDYAKRSASLLATIARRPGSPFEPDLAAATPALGTAINSPVAPDRRGRGPRRHPRSDRAAHPRRRRARHLPTRPGRLIAADNLARNIRRFGRDVAPEQETRLVAELDSEADATLRNALAAVVGALRPTPDASGSRLQTYRASSR